MKNTESESEVVPFEFDSPVEFVLVGVAGRGRAVLAKSKGAQLDLVAYAQREHLDDEFEPPLAALFPFLFPGALQTRPLAVDSPSTDFPSNHAFDRRSSELTLVWRGLGGRADKKEIANELRRGIEAIGDALDRKSPGRLEWALSSVIDRCHRATKHAQARRLRRTSTFWFVLLVYAVGIMAWLVTRGLIRY